MRSPFGAPTGATPENLAAFSATGYDHYSPPDTQLAVGPTAAVEAVNSELSIWSKTGSAVMHKSLSAFFSVPSGYSFTDPRILYDAASMRFFLSGLAFDAAWDSIVYIAVSDTTDPAGSWTLYTVTSETATITDQPKIGVSSDKIVISWNDYDASFNFTGQETWVLQKSDLLTGAPIAMVAFPLDNTRFNLVPAQSLSSTSTEYLVYNDSCYPGSTTGTGSCTTGTSALGIVAITGTPAQGDVVWNETTPGDPAITATASPPLAAEPGGGSIDTNDDRLLSAVWWQGVLWTTASDACVPASDTVTHSCFRLIEVAIGSSTSVLVDTDLASAGSDLYFPAVTVDGAGNPVVVGTISSATLSPSVIAIASSPLSGGFVGNVIWRGSGIYSCSFCGSQGNRWGDYSGAAVDPADPADVWVAAEFAPSLGGDSWGTAIGEITFAAPTVSGLAPRSGSTTGGVRVTITGAEFAPGAQVFFGSKPASTATILSSTELIARAPAASAGSVAVTVRTQDGTSAPSPADRFIYSSLPTVKVAGPSNPFQLSKYLTTRYSATDPSSLIASYDVRYRAASWNGGFGRYFYLSRWQKTTRTSETLVGLPGREYCFSVRARSRDGGLSAWSPDHCTEVPLGARGLSSLTPGWARGFGHAYYLGTYAKTTSVGAKLRLANAELDRMALVVTRCRSCGSVAIYLNGAYWRTVSTYSAITKHQVLLLLPRFSPKRATIVLKDVSKGRQLLIEGLGVTRS
ncbi:MAG: IPT/TIG domain-containing protein [Acidimicrobiales bacterium]